MEELTKMTNKLDGLETSHKQLTDVKAKYDVSVFKHLKNEDADWLFSVNV